MPSVFPAPARVSQRREKPYFTMVLNGVWELSFRYKNYVRLLSTVTHHVLTSARFKIGIKIQAKQDPEVACG